MTHKTLLNMRCLVIALITAMVCTAAYCEDDGAIKLKYEDGVAGKLMTPNKIRNFGKFFKVAGTSGKIAIGGGTVPISASWRKSYCALGLDCNGDGQVSSKEYQKLSSSGSASFKLKLEVNGSKIDMAVTFARVETSVKGTAVEAFGGYVYANCCMKGKYKDKDIRIIDDNLDGEITQDGLDAICVGKSKAAVPLLQQTQIGSEHCRLKVNTDGTMTVTPIAESELQLGRVDVPIKSSMVRCLVLVEEKKGFAYDLSVSGDDGIPAGNYVLSYGVLGKGNQILPMFPSLMRLGKDKDKIKLLTYEIKADMINSIRIGPPFQVDFRCTYNNGKKEFTVQPDINIFGDGGEQYGLDFVGGPSTPVIAILNGNKTLSQRPMGHG